MTADGAATAAADADAGDHLREITKEQLSEHDGNDSNKEVWVAVKGIVFDVTKNRGAYAPGKGYSIFAGKDASKALGKSSLKIEDCESDYSELDEGEVKVLNDWLAFFKKVR